MPAFNSTSRSPAERPPVAGLLATMDEQGNRRWLAPFVSKGAWWQRRLIVAWTLIAFYSITPFLSLGGMPLVPFDIPLRRLVFFGTVLRPTDTLLLALLTLIVFFSIFLLTAVCGRVWCGWMCPQTVYLEFVYRPLQYFFLGASKHQSASRGAGWRYLLLALTYLLASAHLSNTCLAWFVGARPLTHWIFQSPAQHPVAFTMFAAMTVGMLYLFGSFREQLCSIVCPYGRFQSVLLDRFSLVVGYDARRGEPRGKRGATSGQCVDCGMCVRTCPAGIDIRRGLQMECIHCTQCIDACDKVMVTLRLPTGLIRYGSQEYFDHDSRTKWLRPRVVIYPIILLAFIGAFTALLVARTPIALTQLRIQDERVMTESSGEIRTPVRVRLDNQTNVELRCDLRALAPDHVAADAHVTLEPFGSMDAEVIVLSVPEAFVMGRRSVQLRVSDNTGYALDSKVTLLGPLVLPPVRGSPSTPLLEKRN